MHDLNLLLALKALHIIAIISWMAGILYLYRLFVYHREKGTDREEIHSLLSLMEKRLLFNITLPALVVSLITGICMVILNPAYLYQLWFQIKATCALALIGATHAGYLIFKKFRRKDFRNYTGGKLRFINEVPTLLMIIIVIMVIFRP